MRATKHLRKAQSAAQTWKEAAQGEATACGVRGGAEGGPHLEGGGARPTLGKGPRAAKRFREKS